MSASPELTTLTSLARALSQPAALADALTAALATIAEMLGLETGWVWLLDEGSDEPRLAASLALPPALRHHPNAMRGDCWCLKGFRTGDLRRAANVSVVSCSRLARVFGDPARDRGRPVDDETQSSALHWHAIVPLVVGERRVGMLNVASRDWRVLTDDELQLLTTAGVLVSLAVERSRLEGAGARAAAAEERNRLAREIHDTLAQALAALTMQLEVADALTGPNADVRLQAALARALTLARTTLDEARHSVLELRAAPLEGHTLPQALERLATSLRERAPSGAVPAVPAVRVTCEGLDDGARLPTALEVGLYRIAEQALGNVARHAAAHRAEVRLTRLSSDCVRLRIEDDGTGFDPAAVPAGRFGLVGMTERARLLGGGLTVRTALGGGTSITVLVPVRAHAERAR
jgi:two-component system NarL family sensor kinase